MSANRLYPCDRADFAFHLREGYDNVINSLEI